MERSLADISAPLFALVLAATAALVATVGVGGLLLVSVLSSGFGVFGRDTVIFIIALATGCIPAPLAWLVVRRAGVSWRALGWRSATGRHLLLAAVVAVTYVALGVPVYRAIGLEEELDGYMLEELGQYLDLRGPDPFRFAAFLLLVGPLAAIAEELFFRGFVFGWLRHRMGALFAAVLSAALFSAVHFHYLAPGGLLGMTAAADIFVTGLLLAWLYQVCGSLLAPVVLHAVNNLAITLFVVFAL